MHLNNAFLLLTVSYLDKSYWFLCKRISCVDTGRYHQSGTASIDW